jgi:hypothetical protein
MRKQFHVTYQIVTPESAKHADAAERGFLSASGVLIELPPGCCGAAAGKVKDECAMTLQEAVNLIGCVEDVGTWFVETDGRNDYASGQNMCCSLHPPDNITAASYARLSRWLGAC